MRCSALFTILLPLAVSVPAFASDTPVIVPAPVEKVFVPLGFDDNDAVEVVIHGHFPNTCYKTGLTSASVDNDTFVVTIDAQAYLYQGVCAQVIVSYSQTVKLGFLKRGVYQIVVSNSPQAEAVPLPIMQAASPNADDFLYAPVDTVALRDHTQMLRLEGEWPYTYIGCMVMREVKTQLTPGNVLVIQPIAMFTDGRDCDSQRNSHKYSIDVPVPTTLGNGEYLLHARVLNGSAINQFSTVAEAE